MNALHRWLGLLLLSGASCTTVHDWRELRTDPMALGECYDGLQFIVQRDGFAIDSSNSDRGLGTLQSRWRERVLDDRHPGRFRLLAEILVDEGSNASGWTIRYAIEQQRVKDLRRTMEPREEDWSGAGQDGEREVLLGEKLVRRLSPRAMAPATTKPRER